LLAVALVTPVFAADKGSMELDIKIGAALMSKVSIDNWDGDADAAFLANLDFFYYVMPELAIGAGAEHIFDTKVKDTTGKVGFTNLYAQAKYVFDFNDDLFNNIYPLIQIGYGITGSDDFKVDSNGLYWGIGAGTTIKENFVFEIIYSVDNSKFKSVPSAVDAKYSTLKVKVGYKFAF
jgi:hypothetical protein